MSGPIFFDDLEAESSGAKVRKPIWAINLDLDQNEKGILKWLNAEVSHLKDRSEVRFRDIKRNLELYKGLQFEDNERRVDTTDRSQDRSRLIKRLSINHLYDLTQNRISRLIKFKPAVSVLPTNDEFSDKISAKMTDNFLSHIWYVEDFEGRITPEFVKLVSVMGEAYLWIVWNPDKGDLHPDFKEAEKKGERVTLVDEDGNPVTDDAGNVVKIKDPVRVGDIDYEVVMTTDVLLDKKQRIEDVNYCFRRKVMSIDEARLLYPDSASKVKAHEDTKIFDFEELEDRKLESEVVVWEFTHKRHKALDKGLHVVFTKDGILHIGDNPYSHGDLPFERLTDVDYPGETHGVSYFNTVRQITSVYNNLTSLIYRNQILASHPKWVLPVGSAKIDQLGNDITIVQYKGPVPPQLVQSRPTPNELFEFRKQLKEEFQQISGVFGVSRGEPPPGIKAGVALQFLSEQENERFNELVLKYNDWIRRVAIKTIGVAGDYYEKEDGRTVRILGENNAWMSEFLDVAHLGKDYDVRVENSSALPRSRAAKTQTLLDLNERFPEQLRAEMVLDMLDLAQSDKFISLSTVSVRHAEAENEALINSKQLKEPQDFEDHLIHWEVHMKKIREWSFKHTLPEKIQDKFKAHVMVHEMFMIEAAKKNPLFAQKLTALDNFPIFFSPENQALEQQEIAQDNQSLANEQALADQALQPQPFIEPAQVPVNPELGGEPQAPVQEEVPSLVEQGQVENVQPTSAL